jgi:hypothetical protein
MFDVASTPFTGDQVPDLVNHEQYSHSSYRDRIANETMSQHHFDLFALLFLVCDGMHGQVPLHDLFRKSYLDGELCEDGVVNSTRVHPAAIREQALLKYLSDNSDVAKSICPNGMHHLF